MKIVADTTILIDILRSKEPEKSFFYRLNKENDITISFITVAELFSGKSAQSKPGREKLKSLLEGIKINIPDINDAFKAGELKYDYRLALPDAFIAALALKLNLPIASFDQKAFKRVKNLKFYQDN